MGTVLDYLFPVLIFLSLWVTGVIRTFQVTKDLLDGSLRPRNMLGGLIGLIVGIYFSAYVVAMIFLIIKTIVEGTLGLSEGRSAGGDDPTVVFLIVGFPLIYLISEFLLFISLRREYM